MIYLYTKRGRLINKFNSIDEISKQIGYSKQKLSDCLDFPGMILGSCFLSPYRWRNSKKDKQIYAEKALVEKKKYYISRLKMEMLYEKHN